MADAVEIHVDDGADSSGTGVKVGHGDVLFTLDLLPGVTLTARGTSSARNQKRFAVVCIDSGRITRASKSKKGGMMLRTVEDRKTLLRDKSPQDAAQRILRDIPPLPEGRWVRKRRHRTVGQRVAGVRFAA